MSTILTEKVSRSKKKTSLTGIAYSYIRESIVTNKIQPGDVLSEMQLAQQLRISRTPIHSALTMLESEGLVEIHQGIGAFVKSLDYQSILDIFEAREPLEITAIKSAINNITAKDISDLRELFNALSRQLSSGKQVNSQDFFKADFEFHNLLIERCNNRYIQHFMRIINSDVRRLQVLSFNHQYSFENFIEQHLHLLDIIESHDLLAVEEELKHHLKVALDNICLQ